MVTQYLSATQWLIVLSSSKRMHLDLQEHAFISSFSPVPPAAPTSFYDGTMGKQLLANMRGAGALILEHDFPPGSDIIGQIVNDLNSKRGRGFARPVGLRPLVPIRKPFYLLSYTRIILNYSRAGHHRRLTRTIKVL